MGALTAPEPLGEHHSLEQFDCGEAVLNAWLIRRARGNAISGASRTFVVCENAKQVVGYYCLATGAVTRANAPGKIRRNMPEPIPVLILGRLATDVRWQGHGVGRGLLKDAILRSLSVSSQVGVRALLVHAISEDARRFYLHWGFRPSPIDPMMLMIRMNEAAAALEDSS